MVAFPSVQVIFNIHLYTLPKISDTLVIGLLMFEPGLEAQQTFVPFSTDFLNPLIKLLEGFRR